MNESTPETTSEYGISKLPSTPSYRAPQLAYDPVCLPEYRQRIGLIGAGGISEFHLKAYRKMDLEVVWICDLDPQRAAARAAEFYPDARTTSRFEDVLKDDTVPVVDVATQPEHRNSIITNALQHRKHILCQKPFVVDLDEGARLADLADEQDVRMAINQNGRWAPHFQYMIQATRAHLIGPVSTIDFLSHWDHTWTIDSPFNEIHHLVLYDFGIHWFDLANVLMAPLTAESVFASVRHTSYQKAKPPYLATAIIDYPQAQVRINFNAHVQFGQKDQTVVAGKAGTLRASGPSLNEQELQLWTRDGVAVPALNGCWFDNGFRGTMCELLAAIAEGREPSNSARTNLKSLELCFAAIASANSGRPTKPGQIRAIAQK